MIEETYASPARNAGVPGLAYCLVGTGISSGSITDLTKQPSQAMRNLKIYKVRFKLPVCISLSPVHGLDDGACRKRSLVEAGWSDLWAGETIRRCIAWPSGNWPACRLPSCASAPRFPE